MKSQSFTKPSRVLARFSVGGGNLESANTDRLALRGFSFRLGSDEHRSDILTQSAPVHFARTLDQMLAYLRARMPGTDGKPDAKKVRAFSAANPGTLHQANYLAARPLPESFAGTTYWGVHAFPATNAKGETRFTKFKVAPVGEDVTLTESKAQSADFLNHDLEERIAAGDVRFSVMALLDRPGDPVTDVTIRWPDEDRREAVRLGTIVITGVEAKHACEASAFNPANLAEGIGYPPDEIFAARRVGACETRAIGGGTGIRSNRSAGTAIALAEPQLRSGKPSRCPDLTGRREKMTWKSIVSPGAFAPASARWSAMSGFVRETAETVSDFASLVHNLVMDVRDSYRPELHYMRGPGPKWRAKHQPWLTFASEASGRQQLSPVSMPHRNAANPTRLR